jgi:protein involved in polysaccharide export with SLBB domain
MPSLRHYLPRFMRRHAVPLVLGLLSCPAVLRAQATPDADVNSNYVTRDTLEQIERRMRLASESPGYSEVLRDQARDEAEAVKTRLEQGDFRVGDRISLEVELEPTLTDTFTVSAKLTVLLPEIGDIDLHGVLRSEVQHVFQTQLAQYVRNPVVRAQSLLPITVLGGGNPGFYTFPSETRMSEVLNRAGRPGTLSEFNRIEIRRGNTVIASGRRLQEQITQGVTLDQLNLLAGDQIILPLQQAQDVFTRVRTFTLLLTIPFTMVGLFNLIF